MMQKSEQGVFTQLPQVPPSIVIVDETFWMLVCGEDLKSQTCVPKGICLLFWGHKFAGRK